VNPFEEPLKPALMAGLPPPTPHGLPVQQLRVAAVLVFVSLIGQHGFPLGSFAAHALDWLDALLALFFCADLVLAFRDAKNRRRVLGLRRFEYILMAGFAGAVACIGFLPESAAHALTGFLHLESKGALAFNLVKLFLLLSLCIQLMRGTQQLFGKGVRPVWILAGSFATLVLIGTFLLLLPNSSAPEREPIGVVDALFTATSATCVTGLVVRDTGMDFSGFGHFIILALFQFGGLGIITFVAFLSVFSTRALPVPQMVAFRQIINAPKLSAIKRQITGILLTAVLIELTGIILLYQFLPAEGDTLARIKWSAFHAISAFCSAGFALQADSLESFRGNTGLNLTIIGLITLGGLGFLVISELVSHRWTRTQRFRRFGFFRRLHAGRASGRLSLQTKLALGAAAVLLVAGFAGFWMLEAKHSLRSLPAGEGILAAAFQSATARTVGLNTLPIGSFQDATLWFLMILMVIGANPVSTGGGIKTVNFAILLLALRAMVTRRDRVEAFGRTVPNRTLLAALSVFVIYVITASIGVFLLALFDPDISFQSRAFEVVSALSTVGLSTGITAELSSASKLVLCVIMFIGRVGPISLVLSVFQGRRTAAYEFPEEDVVVG
jgi:trk system potassium uptake protein TrkH